MDRILTYISKVSHNGPRKVVLARGNAEGHYDLTEYIKLVHYENTHFLIPISILGNLHSF